MTVDARRVLDALPLTIYTVDLDGCITSANVSWSRFAEDNGAVDLAPESSVVGRRIFAAISDQASTTQIERAMELLRTGRTPVVSWEFPCNSPTEERVFLMQVTALHSPSRAVSGFVFCTVDITPSHHSREALIDAGIALARTISLDHIYREVARQLRRAVKSDALVIALADDDTAALRIVHAVGYTDAREALEQRLASTWLDALATGRVALRHSGVGLELTVPMTSAEGVLGAITVVADDIDSPQGIDEADRLLTTLAAQTAAAIERAWLVQRVEHKRRLEAIGEVSAGVAHELRNPLFGISSAAQLLRFRSKEDPVVEKNVGRILREVERLNRMVTALLDFGRPNTAEFVPADPDAVWDEVLDVHRGQLEARSLALRRERSDPPAHCLIDGEQMAQVYMNVLFNAAAHAPEGSDLTLTSQTLANGSWRCRLHNGGPAIPPEVLPRVFEIFFSTKSGGTGIGLALCQRILDEHQGTITLESTPEAGTTLTLWLPAAST